jgi:hypothetical protein
MPFAYIFMLPAAMLQLRLIIQAWLTGPKPQGGDNSCLIKYIIMGYHSKNKINNK